MPIDGKLPTSKTFIGTLSDMILGSSKHAASERAMQTAKAEIDIQIADYQGVLSDIVASSEEHCPEPSAGVASATAEMRQVSQQASPISMPPRLRQKMQNPARRSFACSTM
jgi:hypothetical protein